MTVLSDFWQLAINNGRFDIMGYFTILAAIPGFFLSAFFLMLFWGIIAPDFGLQTVNYSKAMLITIALWLAIAPLTAAGGKKRWWR
jgi:hypothetical protein